MPVELRVSEAFPVDQRLLHTLRAVPVRYVRPGGRAPSQDQQGRQQHSPHLTFSSEELHARWTVRHLSPGANAITNTVELVRIGAVQITYLLQEAPRSLVGRPERNSWVPGYIGLLGGLLNVCSLA